jgi:hypothetical protein
MPQSKQLSVFDQTETVKHIWDQLVLAHYQRDVGFVTELPLTEIFDWMIKQGVVVDRDKAKKAIQ